MCALRNRHFSYYLDNTVFIMAFMDVVGIINNTNTMDSLLSYQM